MCFDQVLKPFVKNSTTTELLRLISVKYYINIQCTTTRGRQNREHSLIILNVPQSSTKSTFKYLGVYLDNKVNLDAEINTR